MDLDSYTEFENNFRGSPEQIMDVLSNYDGVIDYILNIDKYPTLLDIGSGKGEWIEKCNAKGFKSIGIELDSKLANDCKNLNLNIKEGDALSLLDDFDEDTFSIVSAFHVIEQMSHENIKELLVKSKRILKTDGLLILETPSIDRILVSTKSFHIDPTYLNAIHPDLLDLMIKKSGFNNSKYYFINGGKLKKPDHVKLSRVLSGVAQDVVFIASKSKSLNNLIFNETNLIERDLRQAMTTLEAANDFDNDMSNRLIQYDEAIFLMRKRIIDLESQLQKFIRIYNKSFFFYFINKMTIVKRKIYSLKIVYKKIVKIFIRPLIDSKIFIFIINRIYKIDYLFYLLRSLERKLDQFGFRIYQYKFVKRSKRRKEDIELVDKHDKYLENYIDKSGDAKKIFLDLDKYSKL